MAKATKRTKARDAWRRTTDSIKSAAPPQLETMLAEIEAVSMEVIEAFPVIITGTPPYESMKNPPQRTHATLSSRYANQTKVAIEAGNAHEAARFAMLAQRAFINIYASNLSSMATVVERHCVEWRGEYVVVEPDSKIGRALRLLSGAPTVSKADFVAVVWGAEPKPQTLGKLICDLNDFLHANGLKTRVTRERTYILARATL